MAVTVSTPSVCVHLSLSEACVNPHFVCLQVEHFTRYGMHQYVDNDEQDAKKLKRPPIKPQLQVHVLSLVHWTLDQADNAIHRINHYPLDSEVGFV